jgi:hypothetical protein
MSERANERSSAESSAEAAGGKREWHAPALTVLGDARTLTETGGATVLDALGSS